MWDKIIEFLLAQGFAGIAIICLATVLILIYNEAKKERDQHKTETKENTEKFVNIALESVKYIQENTSTLKDLREEIKQHNAEAQESRRTSENSLEKMLILLDTELKNRGRG